MYASESVDIDKITTHLKISFPTDVLCLSGVVDVSFFCNDIRTKLVWCDVFRRKLHSLDKY